MTFGRSCNGSMPALSPARRKVEREGVCRICAGTNPQAAHIWPKSLGAKGYEDPENIVPLCQACHGLFDSGRLAILPYLTLDEQAAAVKYAGLARAYRRLTVS